MSPINARQLLARYMDAYRLQTDAYASYIKAFNKNNFGKKKDIEYKIYLSKKAYADSLYNEIILTMTGGTDESR